MSSTKTPRWWVAINSKPVGPWTFQEIESALRNGQINQQTLTCPVSGAAWFPITQVNELRSLFAVPASSAANPVASQAVPMAAPVPEVAFNPYSAPSGIEINPIAHILPWPGMAALVGIYFLFVKPSLTGIDVLHTLVTGVGEHPDSIVYWPTLLLLLISVPCNLIAAGLSVTAGLKWQAKLRSAVAYSYAVIIIDLVLMSYALLVLVAWIPVLANFEHGPETPTSPISTLLFILGLASLAWEIAVLIWLLVAAKKLPWLSE